MSYDDGERTLRVLIVCGTIFCVLVVVAVLVDKWKQQEVDKTAIESGYVQQIVEGKTIWVKGNSQ